MNKNLQLNPEDKLLQKISQLEKENREFKLYLNQIRIYKSFWEKRLHGFGSSFSIVYQLWKLHKEFFNLLRLHKRKAEEKRVWEEIQSFSKKRRQKSLDIFNFGVIPYEFRHLRQQHLVEQLAKKGHRIFYIENEFLPVKKENQYGSFKIKKYKENIYLVTLSSIRNIFIYFQKPTSKEVRSILVAFRNLKKKINTTNSVVKIDYPFWGYLMKMIDLPIIYDCMDDYQGFAQTEKHILDIEKVLLKKSDLVVVCSNLLKAKLEKYLPKNTILLKNAGEYEHFEKAAHKIFKTPEELLNVRKPIIGYFGAIGEFIDTSLLKRLALRFKDCSIVLIGELRNQAVIGLPETYKNIFTLGEKPYSSLPAFLQEFDVCLIPFVVNKSTQLIDPVKLYEYLASGKPVVVTDIKEIYEFEDVVYISKNYEQFIQNVSKALEEKDKTLTVKRQHTAKLNTWESRGNVLNSALEALMKPK